MTQIIECGLKLLLCRSNRICFGGGIAEKNGIEAVSKLEGWALSAELELKRNPFQVRFLGSCCIDIVPSWYWLNLARRFVWLSSLPCPRKTSGKMGNSFICYHSLLSYLHNSPTWIYHPFYLTIVLGVSMTSICVSIQMPPLILALVGFFFKN